MNSICNPTVFNNGDHHSHHFGLLHQGDCAAINFIGVDARSAGELGVSDRTGKTLK